MTGAESLVRALLNAGIEVCFTNPGTSEIHVLAAMGRSAGMRVILGLFEGVCTGAADGYARMAGKPAATLLHLGPGLGNGIANLHNARRACSPLVNIVGDHATYHLKYDAPLTSDIEALAGTVSNWTRKCRTAGEIPGDAADAVAAATDPPGSIATLILPADCTWTESAEPVPAAPKPLCTAVDPQTIHRIATVLRSGEPAVILMGGPFLMEKELWQAGRISRATGARIIGERLSGRSQSGSGRVMYQRLPYAVKPALKMLEGTAHLILVGASPPVSFFAWPDLPNWLTPRGCEIHTLASRQHDGQQALEALAEELKAPVEPTAVYKLKRPQLPAGKITPDKVWMALAGLMPEHSIISDEGITSSREADRWLDGAPAHDRLTITGGAIGQGMPVATGAAVACPDRKVFSMQADGSGMYTLQALWTQAHEKLDVVTVIFANRAYRILQGEMEHLKGQVLDAKSKGLCDLTDPQLDWVRLANGMGVPATSAHTAEEFSRQLKAAVNTPGPRLIEVVL